MNEIVEIKKAYLSLDHSTVVEILGIEMIKTKGSATFTACLYVRYADEYVEHIPIVGLESWNFVMEDE